MGCGPESAVVIGDLVTLLIKKAEDTTLVFTLLDEDGVVVPLAGYECYFEMRSSATSLNVLFMASTGDGRIVITDDTFVLTITAEQSLDLPNCTLSGAAMVITPGGERVRLFRAVVVIDPSPIRSHLL